jgi:hypothetical protein
LHLGERISCRKQARAKVTAAVRRNSEVAGGDGGFTGTG